MVKITKNIIVVSNGHGEDAIATNIIVELQKKVANVDISPVNLVGSGGMYRHIGLQPCFDNPIFPSGGFIRNVFDGFKDIQAGLINHILFQYRYIKKIGQHADMVIAVGDIFALWMAASSRCKSLYFLPTAKSDMFMRHNALEKWFIKRHVKKSYPRDQKTTNSFLKNGLNAAYFGNPMMDNLKTETKIFNDNNQEFIVAILPGSREEAYKNCLYCLKLIQNCAGDNAITWCLAKADSIELSKIAALSGWTIIADQSLTYLKDPLSDSKLFISNNFKAVINQADACIGLAGTANEQAAFLEKPVICFEGFGPQTTLKRFQEQRQLMGKNIVVCQPRSIENIVTTLKENLVKNKQYIKNQTASEQIADDLYKNFDIT